MDTRFSVGRDELYSLQMDLKQVQLVQTNQADRLARLERRQEQDANLKSVWQQHPFPGVLAGTPQQGELCHIPGFNATSKAHTQLTHPARPDPRQPERLV